MATVIDQTLRANARLRIRQERPSTSALIIGYVEVGAEFVPAGIVEGEPIAGNPRWFELDAGRFVWSGASSAVSTAMALPPQPSAGMKIRRRPDGTIQVLTDSERKSVFGTFTYRESSPKGAIEIDRDWERDNIVEIATPILAPIKHPRLFVHRKAADPFQRVFARIEEAGLADRIRTCAGTFVPRHMGWNPARGLSTHSWGAAIDLNAEWNGYGSLPAALGSVGCVRELVSHFEAEGFGWGGYFQPRSICDGMHFELSRLDL
jgi:hypothetical protein